ncbi:MAG: GPW/gp25 family protein [Acidobacteriota bacterium]|nr:GPW/gp25 family protein [Acidobacteriota bacterium]
MKFPLTIGENGAETSNTGDHISEQIKQVLFTNPGERVFRPEFGVGVRALVFEPNGSALREVTRKRLIGSLAEALRGEVDPKTLDVQVVTEDAKLRITISYTLARIGVNEKRQFLINPGGTLHG